MQLAIPQKQGETREAECVSFLTRILSVAANFVLA